MQQDGRNTASGAKTSSVPSTSINKSNGPISETNTLIGAINVSNTTQVVEKTVSSQDVAFGYSLPEYPGLRLTQALVRQYVRLLGASFKRSQYGDYVLSFGTGDARSEYFSADLTDVIETARVMLGGHACFGQAENLLAYSSPGYQCHCSTCAVNRLEVL